MTEIIQPPVTLPDGSVLIDFSVRDGVYSLHDAIILSAAQYASMTPADIETEVQKRYNDYVAFIDSIPETSLEDGNG